MSSPRKGGENPILPPPVSGGQKRDDSSRVLGAPKGSSNNPAPSTGVGEGATRPIIDAHQEFGNRRRRFTISSSSSAPNIQAHPRTSWPQRGLVTPTGSAKVGLKDQGSSKSDSIGPMDGVREHPDHSSSKGLISDPPVDPGPRVEVLVLGPDPRLTAKKIAERPPTVVDPEKEVVTPAGHPAPRGLPSLSQREASGRRSEELPPNRDRASTSAPKATGRGSIGGGGMRKDGDKPHAVAGSPFSVPALITTSVPTTSSTAITVRASPVPFFASRSRARTLLKPPSASFAPKSFKTHRSSTGNTQTAATIAPPTMGSYKYFTDKISADSTGGDDALSGTLPNPIPKRFTASAGPSSPSMAQETPKLDSSSDISPIRSPEYLKDRELAKKALGISGEEFDAEMSRRNADYEANIARRIALGHPIHGSQVAYPGGQNSGAADSKTGENSGDAQKVQMDTARDEFTSHAMENAHLNSDDEMLLKAYQKEKDKQGAGIYDTDDEFCEKNRWPGADNLESPSKLRGLSPRWQPENESFVAGAPKYHIPQGFFGSSPPASPLSPGPHQPAGKPKYVDRGTAPDLAINCFACKSPLVVSLGDTQSDVYDVHLKDHDEFAHQLFSSLPKNYYLLHVLVFAPYRSRVIHSDKAPTLRNFTKIVRLGFNMHTPISQITVYLYGRDREGLPLEWKAIPIVSLADWDASMSVAKEWSCQISVVVEFAPPDTDGAVSATIAENPENGEDEVGPGKATSPQIPSGEGMDMDIDRAT
ncbi:hypothetical protein HOY82DRAFT_541542 [Tuber indicum]|nr:hypothetical protein HOY82DRAFT_541542 [Tuber indicum]